jgi:mannose-1-phosphate guanylyltransferase
MRAILLAAGLGSRLRPLTNNTPKCLVKVKGRPLLEIWLDKLTQAGIGPLLVNTHYLSEQVDTFIKSSCYRDKVTLIHEIELKGTAGTLLENIEFYQEEDGLLIHADNYCHDDFISFQEAHRNRPKKCLMTMMTFRTDTPSSCGIVELDEEGVVVAFYEKVSNPPGNLANGAVYILSSELLKILDNEFHMVNDFSNEILNKLVGSIYTYETKEIFIDIGTINNYVKANN